MQNDALLKDLAHCGSAETLLGSILKHYPDLRAPIPVEDIARSVGINEFCDLEAESVTSGVKVGPDKATGVILSSADLAPQRRRFAIAHQLGHYLLSTQHGDRQCANRDLNEIRRDTPHRKEEAQANRFAAGLLMPKPLFMPFVETLGKPTVLHLQAIAAAYDVSLDAAASRYADMTPSTCALFFIKGGIVRFARPSRSFPPLSVRQGGAAPQSVRATGTADRLAWVATEPRDWLVMSRDIRPPKLTMQVLEKKNGLQLVMLLINAAAERRADEQDEKFATERPKFGR